MVSSSYPHAQDRCHHSPDQITAGEFRPPRAASREGGGGVYWSSPQSEMVIFLEVRPDREPKASTFLITSIPSFTLPKTTCRPSSLNEQRRLVIPLNGDIVKITNIPIRVGKKARNSISEITGLKLGQMLHGPTCCLCGHCRCFWLLRHCAV